jgi:serine/threonine protein kinase
MTLTAGTRLGPYEVLSPLGAGGMGEVYRAHDARLGRDVAIKILPEGFAADADRLRRFEQEARAAAALNHPNILHILDVGTDGPTSYVVAELLEGQTLREKLAAGALPLSKAIDTARQIALGLAAAHAKGITHRDIKPENVFVLADGHIKILDFGLAKLREEASGSGPTRLHQSTGAGVVLGTTGYMSPEQVRAQPVDPRSDIFSAGIVLFEMVTGTRPFQGDSVVETMNAILKEDPPDLAMTSARPPPGLQRIIRHALEKGPAERFQSARDLAFALEALSGSGVSSDPSAPALAGTAAGSRRPHLIPWIVAGVTTVGLLVALPFATGYIHRPPADLAVVRFPVALAPNSWLDTSVDRHDMSLSPDGRWLVFLARSQGDGGQRKLWVRPLSAVEPQAVPGTEGASSPFWSPDSQTVAFFADGKLRRIDPAGASPHTICDLPGDVETTGTWGRDGTILYTLDVTHNGRSIYRVAATGMTPPSVVKIPQTNPHWIYFLPDGRHYLFHNWTDDANEGIYAGSLDTGETTRVLPDVVTTRVEYAQGYLLYARLGTLMAQPFDVSELHVTGDRFPVVERLPYFDKTGWSEFSTSANGVLAFTTELPTTRLAWLDRHGKETELIGEPARYQGARLSHDGLRLAMTIADPRTMSGDLWIQDVKNGTPTRFAFGPADESEPVWSHDGQKLAYFSCCEKSLAEASTLRVKSISDSGQGETPVTSPGFDVPDDWSQDGHYLMFTRSTSGPTAKTQLWFLTDEHQATPWMKTAFSDGRARFSPNGQLVAYVSDEAGHPEIYVARFKPPYDKQRVSRAGGLAAEWNHDGTELFFVAQDRKLMKVAITARETLALGARELLAVDDGLSLSLVGVALDGQHVLAVRSEAQAQTAPFTVVLNWLAEFKR